MSVIWSNCEIYNECGNGSHLQIFWSPVGGHTVERSIAFRASEDINGTVYNIDLIVIDHLTQKDKRYTVDMQAFNERLYRNHGGPFEIKWVDPVLELYNTAGAMVWRKIMTEVIL